MFNGSQWVLKASCALLLAFFLHRPASAAIPELAGSRFVASEEIVLVGPQFREAGRLRLKVVRALEEHGNRKLVAALLAFPFPFGIVGLHRIYLGTAPYVPVVYIGTLGGVLGILPFIDFCVLLMDKNVDRYINNQRVFMWVE